MYELSLKMSLDEIIEEGLDYERKVLENLFRFSTFFGSKIFKVIFLHKNVKKEVIEEFVLRNEKILFFCKAVQNSSDSYLVFAIINSLSLALKA